MKKPSARHGDDKQSQCPQGGPHEWRDRGVGHDSKQCLLNHCSGDAFSNPIRTCRVESSGFCILRPPWVHLMCVPSAWDPGWQYLEKRWYGNTCPLTRNVRWGVMDSLTESPTMARGCVRGMRTADVERCQRWALPVIYSSVIHRH